MTELSNPAKSVSCLWWQPIVFASMAGGMAWGIRGQYGHETGAMIAGLLVSLVLTYLLCPRASSLTLARTVAWCTLAMGIGGSMTYGQTVGLTHDGPLIGNAEAYRWGMLGLAIKGGIWIGFAGAFLGMGWSKVRYHTVEILLLMLALLAMHFLGVYLLNSPFDPDNQVLPTLYFSDDWHWEPEGGFEPRFEQWGGLLLALTTLITYTGWYRKDRLACHMALWGVFGGALGFPIGQSFQAFNAWNREMLTGTWWDRLGMNWWNTMETIYGATMGAILGLGAWLNRTRIQPADAELEEPIPGIVEIVLLGIHLPMLLAVEFREIRLVDMFYDLGLIMIFIPMVAVTGGRWWPFLQVLPLTAIPIAGKTYRALSNTEDPTLVIPNVIWYIVVPVGVALMFAIYYAKQSKLSPNGIPFIRWSLLLTTLIYFGLNDAFFGHPWPWKEWSGRSSNGLIFLGCAICLCILALLPPKFTRRSI